MPLNDDDWIPTGNHLTKAFSGKSVITPDMRKGVNKVDEHNGIVVYCDSLMEEDAVGIGSTYLDTPMYIPRLRRVIQRPFKLTHLLVASSVSMKDCEQIIDKLLGYSG
jgi:hypothetical protein